MKVNKRLVRQVNYRSIRNAVKKQEIPLNNSEDSLAKVSGESIEKIQSASVVGGKRNATITRKYVKKAKALPPIQKVEKAVLDAIVGQDEQVRKILTAIYKSKKFESLKTNLLIVGNSGTGKTETVKQIAKKLNLPYTIEDATKYTKEGYYGNNVEDMIYNLLENANYDVELAQQGIIIIDEIDKKAGYESDDVGGVAVLKSLLKMIEGTTFPVAIQKSEFDYEELQFNTGKLTIIVMGAFSGIEKIIDKRTNAKWIGFSNTENETKIQNKKILKQDLVKYGLPEEFVGRIDTIVEMNVLRENELTSILKNSNLSIFKRYEKALKQKGITLMYDEKIFRKIAKASIAVATGARELTNTVNYMFENIMYDVISHPRKYSMCKLSLEIVEDNTKYEIS